LAAGNLLATPTVGLTGASITTATGALTPSTSVPLVGLSVNLTAGLLGVAGDVTVALTGSALACIAGQMTVQGVTPDVPVGGSNAGGGGGGSGKFEFSGRKRIAQIEQAVRQQLAPKPRTAPVVLAATLASALSSAPTKTTITTEDDDLEALSLLLDDERDRIAALSILMRGLPNA
jgi:hypothetical protein